MNTYLNLYKKLLLIAALVLPILLSAQLETRYWYWGAGAGLDFATNPPTVLTNNPGTVISTQGLSMSDKQGNLLFYSTHRELRDENHAIIPGSNNISFDGTSGRDLYSLSNPGDSNEYYIFSCENSLQGHFNLTYSTVTIAPIKRMIARKVMVLDSVFGKITVVKHANNHDYWLLTQSWDYDIYAFLVDSFGIASANPVISRTATPKYRNVTGLPGLGGMIDVTPDGRTVAISYDYDTARFVPQIGHIELYDFDRATGLFSNLRHISSKNDQPITFTEFSQSGRFLYTIQRIDRQAFQIGYEYLVQYDIISGTQAGIQRSAFVLDSIPKPLINPSPFNYESLRLGFNGKIYIHKSYSYLDVIHNPDLPGVTSNFQDSALNPIWPNGVGQGAGLYMPTFPSFYFFKHAFTAQDVCLGDTTWFVLNDSICKDSAVWDFGDGTRAVGFEEQGHLYAAADTYAVVLYLYEGNQVDTLRDTVEVRPIPTQTLPNDTTLCRGDTLIVDGNFPAATSIWADAFPNPVRPIADPGQYKLRLQGVCGSAVDSFQVVIEDTVRPNFPDSLFLCIGESTLLRAGPEDAASYVWHDASNLDTLRVIPMGWRYATASNTCGIFLDSVWVDDLADPVVAFPKDTALCVGDTLLLTGLAQRGTYRWQDQSTNDSFVVRGAGQYYLTASNRCGTARDTINVTSITVPSIDLGLDTTLCDGQNLALVANFFPALYEWQDASNTDSFLVQSSGLYWLEATNHCGLDRDSIQIDYIPPPAPNLGPDTALCPGDFLMLDMASSGGNQFVWQDGNSDAMRLISSPGLYWVAADNGSCTVRDSVLLDSLPVPELNLGPADTLLCDGATLTIGRGWPGSTALWNDGHPNAIREIDRSGAYALALSNRCGTATDSINIIAIYAPDVAISMRDTTLCTGDTLIVKPNTNPSGFEEYVWQDGSTADSFLVTSRANLSVNVQNLCGYDRGQMIVSYTESPSLEWTPDTFLCEGESIVLDATSPLTDVAYRWSDFSTEPTLEVFSPGSYSVSLTNGCDTARATREVAEKYCDCEVFFPNAFSPNGDGHNDEFGPITECEFASYELRIFNRWGKEVFYSTDPNAKWGGEDALEGVYVWMLRYRGALGAVGLRNLSGSVTLIR